MQTITNTYEGGSMSVRKQIVTVKGEPTTFWIADYSDGAGLRHQRRFSRKKEATAFHDQTKVDIRAGTHVSPPANLTMADVANKWIRQVEADNRERSTIRQYRQHIDLHIVPRIGAVKLAKMTRGHCEYLRDELLAKLSPALARKVWVSFKSILKHVHCKHIADGVRVAVNDREVEEFEVGRNIPTTDEVKRLIAAAADKPKLSTLLKVAVMTGLRASELCGLRWFDVDLKDNVLHVRQRADRWGKMGPPKSKKGRRSIPFGPDLALALKQWKLACPKGALDLVFPSEAGTVLGYKTFAYQMDGAFRAAHVVDKEGKPKYSPHDLRHFFASWCINPRSAGGRELQLKQVQEWMGHSSIAITMDIYGHLFRDKTDKTEIKASESALLG
jgi:integrase